MRLARASLALAVAVSVPACTLLTSLEGFTSPDAPDATTRDDGGPPADTAPEARADAEAADVRDAATDEAGPPPNLFTDFANGTFETGCPQTGYNSTITTDPIAHGGAQSCRVCAKATGSGAFTFDEDVTGITPVIGARYHGEAWVRAAPNANVPSGALAVTLRSVNSPPFTQVEEKQSPAVRASDTWQLVAVDFDVTKQSMFMDVYVGAGFQTNTCFLLDDVSVRRVK